MRAIIAGLLVLIATAAAAEDKAPLLAAEDALTIEKLGLELEVMQQRAERLRLEIELLKRDFPGKARERDAAIEAAAAKADVKLSEGWRPVLDERVWRKVPVR